MTAIEKIQQAKKEQIEKWGDLQHDPAGWLLILAEEFGEVTREVKRMHFHENGNHYKPDPERIKRYEKELAQTGAVILAMLEQIPGE